MSVWSALQRLVAMCRLADARLLLHSRGGEVPGARARPVRRSEAAGQAATRERADGAEGASWSQSRATSNSESEVAARSKAQCQRASLQASSEIE